MQSSNLIETSSSSSSSSKSISIATNNSTSTSKVNCAKECPCQGVPVIPVPDQWLEVMVTGGFKVWHIIFIIIAFIVTVTVIYCCFHRCRIPRTKQEIEADLMRTNLASKFSEYLQELPNEPFTLIEALKKVQELEEKSEKDDSAARDIGARKRMGWLKLKGKGGDKDKATAAEGVTGANNTATTTTDIANISDLIHETDEDKQEKEKEKEKDKQKQAIDKDNKRAPAAAPQRDAAGEPPVKLAQPNSTAVGGLPQASLVPPPMPVRGKILKKRAALDVKPVAADGEGGSEINQSQQQVDTSGLGGGGGGDKTSAAAAAAAAASPAKTVRRRRHKPNLSRSKIKHREELNDSHEHKKERNKHTTNKMSFDKTT